MTATPAIAAALEAIARGYHQLALADAESSPTPTPPPHLARVE